MLFSRTATATAAVVMAGIAVVEGIDVDLDSAGMDIPFDLGWDRNRDGDGGLMDYGLMMEHRFDQKRRGDDSI